MAKRAKSRWSPPNLDYREGETDTQYFKRLAKMADQRLVRLEESEGMRGKAANPKYEGAYKFAYNRALEMMDEGQIRFNQNIPKPGSFEWRERVNEMQRFLKSPTSTKSGIDMIQKATKSINEKYGTDFKWNEFASFIESGDFEKLKETYGSDVILRAMGKIQAAQDKIKKGLDEHAKSMKGPADDVAEEIMRSKKHLQFKRNMTRAEKEKIKTILRDL